MQKQAEEEYFFNQQLLLRILAYNNISYGFYRITHSLQAYGGTFSDLTGEKETRSMF